MWLGHDMTIAVGLKETKETNTHSLLADILRLARLILCKKETPKQALLKTVKIQMKCHIMRHFIRVYTVSKGKKIFRQKITTFENYNLTTLDIYNGLSQVYNIITKGRTHWYMGESFRIIPEFRILRLTFQRKSATKC